MPSPSKPPLKPQPSADPDNPPTRAVTHNWPRFERTVRRPKIVREWPLSDVERELFESRHDGVSEERLESLGLTKDSVRKREGGPICGGKNTPAWSPEDQASKARPPALQCKNPAGYGTDHFGYGPCVKHTGNTLVVRKGSAMDAGRHLIMQFKAEATLFGGDPDSVNITPQEALMEEVRRSVAMVRYLQTQIAQWNPAAGDLGALPALTDETTRGQGTPTDAAEWLRLYREERAHMVRVSKLTIDAGVDIALLQLEQQKGVLIAAAVRDILDELTLTPQQAELVPQVVPKILMRFSAVDPSEQTMADGALQGETLRETVLR